MNIYDLFENSPGRRTTASTSKDIEVVREFAPAGGGSSGNYFRELASAWYNGTFDTGSLQKGIKSQQDVERLLNRGIVCPDGVTRKMHIDYNSDFDGVEIYSDDYYEYGDHDDTIDSRTGQKWGPYDHMEFSDEDLSEGINEFAADDGGGSDSNSERWYTDDELADIIGDDWFEDFDVSNDGFNIDAYGEKAKKNLVGYANAWFDDKGYNVNVMGVEHNDVDHDLQWYIVGSFHNPRFAKKGVSEEQELDEKWSQKYKSSINCSHPKGFSQKAHCAGKRKHNESIEMEDTCPDCGMCQTHGDHSKDKLDELKCWSGYHRVAGTKAGFPGSCAKNKTNEEDVAEGSLEEVDRRGFLKGLGAAAVAGAAGGAKADQSGRIAGLRAKLAREVGVLDVDSKNYDRVGGSPKLFLFANDGSNFVMQWIDKEGNDLGDPIFFGGGKQGTDNQGNQITMFFGPKIAVKITPGNDTNRIYITPRSWIENKIGWQSVYAEVPNIFSMMKRESVEQGVAEEKCPHCAGPMFSELLMTEKKDACYYKVKSRYKVWPSAYASGALVKCRKRGAANWGNKSESAELDQLEENLHKWFKEKWVRFGPDGKIRGDCARGDDSEGKPKCLPQSKAHALGKKGRASAGARKRRQDPNPERSGKAINVATKRNTNEAKNDCPPATQDIQLNLKNRQKAIDDYGYGPLNPALPNTKFWMAKVEEWNLDSPEEAKSSLCGNCAAFDQREDTLACIAQGIGSDSGSKDPTIEAGDLGYCRFLKFKCASLRTCDAWVTGGPLVDKPPVTESIMDFMQPKRPETKKDRLSLAAMRQIEKARADKERQDPTYVRSKDLPKNPDHVRVVTDAQGDKPPREADYGAEYQAMVRRVAAQEKRKQQRQQPPKKEDSNMPVAVDSTSPIHGMGEDSEGISTKNISPASRKLIQKARQVNPDSRSDIDAVFAYLDDVARRTQDNYGRVNDILQQLDPMSSDLDRAEQELDNVRQVNQGQQQLLSRLKARLDKTGADTAPAQAQQAQQDKRDADERDTISQQLDQEPKPAPVIISPSNNTVDIVARKKADQAARDVQTIHAKDAGKVAKNAAKDIGAEPMLAHSAHKYDPNLVSKLLDPDTISEDIYESRLYKMKLAGYFD
jgi:Family of unknown function (DUF5872)